MSCLSGAADSQADVTPKRLIYSPPPPALSYHGQEEANYKNHL